MISYFYWIFNSTELSDPKLCTEELIMRRGSDLPILETLAVPSIRSEHCKKKKNKLFKTVEHLLPLEVERRSDEGAFQ